MFFEKITTLWFANRSTAEVFCYITDTVMHAVIAQPEVLLNNNKNIHHTFTKQDMV